MRPGRMTAEQLIEHYSFLFTRRLHLSSKKSPRGSKIKYDYPFPAPLLNTTPKKDLAYARKGPASREKWTRLTQEWTNPW